MVFTPQELPPIYNKILQKIRDNGGTITTEDFKKIFLGSPTHTLRMTDDDIQKTIQWLKDNDYIKIQRIPNKAWNITIEEKIS